LPLPLLVTGPDRKSNALLMANRAGDSEGRSGKGGEYRQSGLSSTVNCRWSNEGRGGGMPCYGLIS